MIGSRNSWWWRAGAVGLGCGLVLWGTGGAAAANDRLPERWREGYGVALAEIRNFARYVMARVWREPLAELRRTVTNKRALAAKVAETTDEVVHLLLPQARRIARDALFGTSSTHLRLVQPQLREKALRAAVESLRARQQGNKTLHDALSDATRVAEEALDDRLEQALTEDLEDQAQQLVEGSVGLPLQGRPRNRARALPQPWEGPYQQEARPETHRFTYWWLRKRRRLPLTHLAQTKEREELDRARHEGPVWRMTSGISQEAWAQNRLRLDFKWGRHNWEIDRRRIRRRMDQDTAQATWAMARMVKELTAPDVVGKLKRKLSERLREELEQPDARPDAEDYPNSRPKLEPRLERVKKDLEPLMNDAIGKVPFPGDMGPELQGLAKEHGRRFMHEELRGTAQRALSQAASPHVARKRLRERLGALVAGALREIDDGSAAKLAEARAAAKAKVRQAVKPGALAEVGDARRATGEAEHDGTAESGQAATEQLYDNLRVDDAIDREVDRQLDEKR